MLVLMGGGPPVAAQRFLPDDPLWTDPDRMDITLPAPQAEAPGQMGPFEFLRRTFQVPGTYAEPAANVNTVEGVPNSSWYTNRHHRHPMSQAALRRGPNVEPGPAPQGPWRVVRLPEDATLPRAVVRDSTGRQFRLLFDADAHPEMATGAAMIGSRLLYALGYNVPQHWLRAVRSERLVPTPDSLTQADVDSMLALAPQRSTGAYRVLATRVPGVIRRIGPFQFRGTRPDDPNDIFPHEDRRELRGLRVFSAWLHHSKIRARHTLDVGVEEGGRRFVRHYLTNLHLMLGSAGARPKPQWSGHEHVLELDRVFQRVVTLGLSGGDWARADPPDWPALGHFGSEDFVPRAWRPEWPNPAFQRADSADAFWAAKQVRQFSRADLEAIVSTADYSSPPVANYVVLSLLQRRNAIAQAYLHWGGGLDRFEVREGQLTFADLPAQYGLAPDTLRRTVTWHIFHNDRDQVGEQLMRTGLQAESIPVPSSEAAFLRVTLRTPDRGTTQVYLRWAHADPASATTSGHYEVVGVERTGVATEPQ